MINWAFISQVAMTMAGSGYALAALSYFMQHKPWMATTFFCYLITIGTIYMAGDK